jgi:hypothetical protein
MAGITQAVLDDHRPQAVLIDYEDRQWDGAVRHLGLC